MILCKNKWWLPYFFLACSWIAIEVNSEVFTSLSDVESLLITEREIPKLIKLYFRKVKYARSNNPTLKKMAREFRKSRLKNINAEEFVKNPINVFHLIKRLLVRWPVIKSAMKQKPLEDIIDNHVVKGKHLLFPDKIDISGVALALDRLQQTYNISISKLARGKIAPGIKTAMKLKADDCFDIGEQLNKNELYASAIIWFKQGLRSLKKEKNQTFPKLLFYEFLAHSNFKLGRVTKAKEYMEMLLKSDPKDGKVKNVYDAYQAAFKKAKLNPELIRIPPDKRFKDPRYKKIWDVYELLCRNNSLVHSKMKRRLRCYYHTNKNPYLRIQPVKTEVVYETPKVEVFYDVLSDKDIEIIKKLATSKLARADVLEQDGSLKPTDFRISKSAWINDTTHPTIMKISYRLESITNLNMNASEELQVVNYGVGGFYKPHFDFVADEKVVTSLRIMGIGNRIATFLIYMSDVEVGGATVFPTLGVSVPPKKGSVLFWYNILKTGEVNYNTRHASCPILYGNKWVSNKWVNEFHQEFRRPCGKTKKDIH